MYRLVMRSKMGATGVPYSTHVIYHEAQQQHVATTLTKNSGLDAVRQQRSCGNSGHQEVQFSTHYARQASWFGRLS